MKKILCICLILAMLTPIFAACGKDVSEPNDTDGGIATEAQTDLSSDTEASTDTEETGETGDDQEPEIVLTEYSFIKNADKILENNLGIEFCVSYDEGAVWVQASSKKTTKYTVYVNGIQTGIISFNVFGDPIELPGTAEAAGEKVMIRLVVEALEMKEEVSFRNICVSGILETISVGAPTGEMLEYNISMHQDKFHVQGRSSVVNMAVTTDWSASGIEFYATYTGAIYVQGSATSDKIQFRVYVNGAETGVVAFGRTVETKFLPGTICMKETTAHIRLVRLEYVKDGLASLKSVMLDGTVKPWTENNRKFIEFIGDSISCGYGSQINDAYIDGSRAFTYLSACELNVDYSMAVISGIGVSASTGQHGGKVMGDFYKYLCYYRDPQTLYVPQKQADLVVVNLNTNDWGSGGNVPEGTYKEKARALIADIRAIHGENVNIVWIFGQMTSVNIPANLWLRDVYEELGGEDAGLYIMETETNKQGEGGHPNYANHKVTAKKLVDFINSNDLL